MATKKDQCAGCGANPPFKARTEWRIIRITGRDQATWQAIDEGIKLLCEQCLLPLRAVLAGQARKAS